jgi:hypothetical protein
MHQAKNKRSWFGQHQAQAKLSKDRDTVEQMSLDYLTQ